MAFLSNISNCLKRDFSLSINPNEIAYYIRQINIGMGCFHQCSHCFSNPSSLKVEVMNLDSFTQISEEFGNAISACGKVAPFIFLGSCTDPAMINNFAEYAEVWINKLPIWHPVKFYTHGWNLTNKKQQDEFAKFIAVLSKYSSRITKMAVSFDFFSFNAINNRTTYIKNIIDNLTEIKKHISSQSLRLNVVYPTERLEVDEKYTIGYWRKLADNNNFPNDETFEHILSYDKTAAETKCYELTKTIFYIGERLNYNKQEISKLTTDGGVPIPVGKARSFYKDSFANKKGLALMKYKKHSLNMLNDFILGTEGLFILPNGSVRFIDYDGYRLGRWLNKKQPIVKLDSHLKLFDEKEFTIL